MNDDNSSENPQKQGNYQQENNSEQQCLQHNNASETNDFDRQEKQQEAKKINFECLKKLNNKHKQLRQWWESISPAKRIASFLAVQLVPMTISITLTKITQSDWQNHSNQIEALGDNYNSNFYIDFTVKKQCSTDETNIMQYNWPGLNEGCDCYSITGAINTNYQNCQCSQVPSWDAFQFQYLFTSGQDKLTLCAKRSKLNFFDVGPFSKGSCSSQQKACGNTSKPETVICVGLNDACPIYDIIFTNGVQQPYASDPNWGQIQVNSNQYIYFDKKGENSSSLPLSQFTFTAGAGVCLDNYTQQNIDLIRQDYPLSKSLRQTCSTTDPRFVSAQQIGVNDLYLIEFSNSDYNQLSQLSGMQLQTSTEVYKLYKRPYEPWSLKDRNKILIFSSIIDDVNFEQFLFSASFIINTVSSSVFYVFGIIYGYFQNFNLLGNDKYKIALWNALNTVMSFLSKSLSFIMSVVTLAFALDYALKFTVLINNHPSSNIFQNQCQEQLDYIKSIFKSNYIVTIIFTGIYLLKDIIDLIPDLYTVYKERKKKQQSQKVASEKQEQESQSDESKSNKSKEDKQSKNQGNNSKQNKVKQYEEWKKQQLQEYDNWSELVDKHKDEQNKLSKKQQDEWKQFQQKIQEEQKILQSKQAEEKNRFILKQSNEEQKFLSSQTTEEQKQQFRLKSEEEIQNLEKKHLEEQQKMKTQQSEKQHKILAKQSEEQQKLTKKQSQEQKKLLQSQKEEQQNLLSKQQQENQNYSKDQQQNKSDDKELHQSGEKQSIQKQLNQLTPIVEYQNGQLELKGVINNQQ